MPERKQKRKLLTFGTKKKTWEETFELLYQWCENYVTWYLLSSLKNIHHQSIIQLTIYIRTAGKRRRGRRRSSGSSSHDSHTSGHSTPQRYLIPRFDSAFNNGANDFPSRIFTFVRPDHLSLSQLAGTMPRLCFEGGFVFDGFGDGAE